MRKFLILLFLLTLASGAILYFSKDWLLKAALETGIRNLTGFDSTIRALEVSPKRGIIRAQGLTVLNPDPFTERIFVDIPEFSIHLDLPALMKGRTHLYAVKLNVREINIEKDKQGVSNVSRLTPVSKAEKKAEKREPSKPSAPMQLDELELTLRRLGYIDRSSMVPRRLSADLAVERQVFRDIRDPNAIVHLILLKVLTKAPFVNLGINPADLEATLKENMGRTFAVGDKVFSTAPSAVSQKGEGVFNRVQDSALDGASNLFGKWKSKLPARRRESQETTQTITQ